MVSAEKAAQARELTTECSENTEKPREKNMAGSNTVLGGGGFHHVAMKVADFDGTVRFYTEALGFRAVTAWGEGAKRAIMLDTGDGSCLEIFAGGSLEPKGNGAVAHFALRTKDIDAVIERVRAAGAKVTVEPKDVTIPSNPPMSVRLAFFKGPNGEVVELFHNHSV